MKTQLSKPSRRRDTPKSTSKRRWSYGVRAIAAQRRWRRSWVFERRCCIIGRGPSAKPTTAKVSSAPDEVLKNWKRRSVACAQRTLNFWSSGKFEKNRWASSPKRRPDVRPNRSDFGDFIETTICGPSVPANLSCAINVRFRPTATGERTASMKVRNDGGGAQPVNLREPEGERFGHRNARQQSRLCRTSIRFFADAREAYAVFSISSGHSRAAVYDAALYVTIAFLACVVDAVAPRELRPRWILDQRNANLTNHGAGSSM
jgi:hypothetical protein